MLLTVKSPQILKLLTNYIEPKNALNLIKYNKLLQKRLNLSIKDYKSFINIILEIIPVEPEKLKREKNYFINLTKEIKYYDIYFDDNIQDKNRIYFTKNDKINKIKVVLNGDFTNLSELFYTKKHGQYGSCDCIKEIHFIKFTGENIIDMNSMFYGCSN